MMLDYYQALRELPEPGDGRMTEVIDRICNVAEHFGVDNGR
jgi:hypothetical protein